MTNAPTHIIVHHEGVVRSGPGFDFINSWHKSQQFPKSSLGFFVGYHYVIEKDGSLRQARKEWEEGAHTKGENFRSIGICLVGNFDVELPTKQQIETLGALLADITTRLPIDVSAVFPHRKFAPKSCYGALLHDNWARAVLLRHLCRGIAQNAPALLTEAENAVRSLMKVPSNR